MIATERFTLPNGLRVVCNHTPGAVMAAVNIVYDTGARDESRSLTGIAHLFEHLMFGGSANVPAFDAELERAGGSSNAWTSADFTSFYDVLPAANLETAMHLESDRMLALDFRPHVLETQRAVVIEEFKQTCLNRPYGGLMHALRAALYAPEHPYSWPVIGLTPDHVAAVTEEDVRHWFYSHYAPDDAVMAVSGDITPGHCRALVEKWFGDIPRREIAPRLLPDPGFPDGRREVTVTDPRIADPMLVLAMPMAPYGRPGYRAADCVTDILSAGHASRIFRRLVAGGDGTIVEADASIIGSEHPGFVMINAFTADARPETLDRAERFLMEQIELLGRPGDLDPHELERTLNRFESTFALSNYDPLSRASNLALAEMHGEDINLNVALQRALTAAEIADTAASLAAGPRVSLRYLPG